MNNTTGSKLPELPAPDVCERGYGMGRHDVYDIPTHYTANKMRAYGLACYQAGRRSLDLEQFRDAVVSFYNEAIANLDGTEGYPLQQKAWLRQKADAEKLYDLINSTKEEQA